MRILLILNILIIQFVSVGQSLDNKLQTRLDKVESHYKSILPYSVVIYTNSVMYNNGEEIAETKKSEVYKMVMGEFYNYSYIGNTQMFRDSTGELMINNQKKIIEFNAFRALEHFEQAGGAIKTVAQSLDVVIKDINQKGNRTELYFENEKGTVNIRYFIVNNQIQTIVQERRDEDKNLLHSFKSTFKKLIPNITNDNKYQITGHGHIENEEFIPNIKYSTYETFTY